MTARRLGVAGGLALAAVLAGCGSSHPDRTPTASAVPLVSGARITAQARKCDRGSNAYCAIELVVRDSRYASSDILAHDESHVLRDAGWTLAGGDTGTESAANSPGHKLRLTYSSAADDLESIDLGEINRAWPITYALSTSMFDRAAAMSMMLEVGST